MAQPTEIQVTVTNKKKVVSNPDKEATAVYKYTLKATNVDFIGHFKIKSTKDIAIEEDTFSFRGLVTQKNLEELVEESGSEEE